MMNRIKHLSLLPWALVLLIAGMQPIFSQDISQGLVGYWPLECDAKEFHGTNLDGTLIGNPNCVDGKLRKAFEFTQNQYIEFPKEKSLDFIAETGFSWSIWFKGKDLPKKSTQGYGQALISIIDKELGEDFYLGFGDLTTAENVLVFRADGPDGAGNADPQPLTWKPAGNSWQNDEWYHIVAVRDYVNKKSLLYVNGELATSMNKIYAPVKRPLHITVGAVRYEQDTTANFNGILDEIRVYKRAISPKEVLILNSLRENQLTVGNKTFDFGKLVCAADSTAEISIKNEGPTEFRITDYHLTNGQYFQVVNTIDTLLADQQEYKLKVKFTPDAFTTYLDTLYVDNGLFVPPLIIYLKGEREKLNIEYSSTVSDTLDFGELILCTPNATKTVSINISNRNAVPSLVLDSIKFDNLAYSSDIKIGDELILNAVNNFEFTIAPEQIGLYYAKAEFTFADCIQKSTLFLKCLVTHLDYDYPDTLDFGKVVIGENADSSISFINAGSRAFNITKFDNGKLPFDASISKLDLIAAKDSSIIDIKFNPTTNGVVIDSILVHTNSPCGDVSKTIYIVGEGAYRATFNFKVSQNSANVGDEFELKASTDNIKDLVNSLSDSLNFTLSMNGTMLVPTPSNNSAKFTLTEDVIKASYSFQLTNGDNPTEFNLGNFYALLGNKELDSIYIDEIYTVGGLSSINKKNGYIKLLDVCVTDGKIRLITQDNTLFLQNVYPNPSSGELNISYELIEKGYTKMLISDIMGNEVLTIDEGNKTQGRFEAYLNTESLPAGIYFLILQTPTQVLKQKLVINN